MKPRLSKLETIGWGLIAFGILLTPVSAILGLVLVVIGCICTLKNAPKVKPLYKRARIYVAGVLWVVVVLGGMTNNAPPPITPPTITSLTLHCNSSLEVDIEDTKTISILVSEDGASTENVTFTSSDSNVLTFTADRTNDTLSGIITPKAEGTAEIMISAGDVESAPVTVTIVDSERIAAEEAEKKAAEEEAARKAAEEAAKEAAEQQAVVQQPQEEMVWIPQSGSKYHSKSSCSGMNSPQQVPLSQAISNGYEPCKRCY